MKIRCCIGTTRIICATVAFGLGMDVGGITFIIHWDAATSVAQYMQQVGRGGRDGSQCLCITMFDDSFMRAAFRKARKLPPPGAPDRRDAHSVDVREVWNCSCHVHALSAPTTTHDQAVRNSRHGPKLAPKSPVRLPVISVRSDVGCGRALGREPQCNAVHHKSITNFTTCLHNVLQ